MIKQSMFNEFESVTLEALNDFTQADSDIQQHIKKLSVKYKLIEIEQYLISTVSCRCTELRLINAWRDKNKIRTQDVDPHNPY